jgi:hypothetical protein
MLSRVGCQVLQWAKGSVDAWALSKVWESKKIRKGGNKYIYASCIYTPCHVFKWPRVLFTVNVFT